MEIHCPQCRAPVARAADPRAETVCGSCGASISAAAGATVAFEPAAMGVAGAADQRAQAPGVRAPESDRVAETIHYDSRPADSSDPPTIASDPPGAPPERPLRSFGDYELLDEIAHGGMGVVYKARQRRLNRLVAVKMILRGQLASAAEVQRFHAEAEAAANLHHPNIVAIHEVGEHESLPYFSMDYVRGKSLAALVSEHPLPPRRAAAYVHKIAEAIHYAHQRGILHRDLKPSNVLLDDADQPRITDFGLAKRAENETGLTVSGAVLGTPSYMPPEQAAGLHRMVTAASDVYSTGAILYELVTGRPPFQAESQIETLRQVLDAEPAPPSLVNPKVDRDLETICLKCLQKDSAQRYETAQRLADDLGRYLRGEPIHARPVGTAERVLRWCRRNPRMAGLVAAVLVLLVTVAVGSTTAAFWIAHEQAQTEEARKAAEEQRVRAEANFLKARDAVDQMLTRVADEVLLELPQTEPIRRALLQDALAFYQEFLRERTTDEFVQQETGKTYYRVAEILRMLGETAESKQAYDQAIALFTDLVQQSPDRAEYAKDLADAYNYLGELHRTMGQSNDAEQAYLKAIDLQRNATDPARRSGLARALYNLGIVLVNTSRSADADSAYVEAAAILEDLCERQASNDKFRLDLARCLINRGILLRNNGKDAEAESSYGRAIQLLEESLARHPAKIECRLALAASSNNLGNMLLRDSSRFGEVASNFHRAFELYQGLVRDFPSVPSYRQELANSCNSLAALRVRMGTAAEARRLWDQGRDIAGKLVEEYPDVPDHRNLLGGILGNLGASMNGTDELPLARDLLEDAVSQERLALDANPQHPRYRTFLRTDYLRLARVAVRQGDHERAAEATRLAGDLGLETAAECQRAAFVLAECVSQAGEDRQLADERRDSLGQSYADEAIAWLRRAIEKGYGKAETLRTDPIWKPFHDRNDFQTLVSDLAAKAGAEKIP
jgi:tetratricopeptide (TPR) repeat protein/tRNA A-37 threonylcarbamoyl transferase component Bud32